MRQKIVAGNWKMNKTYAEGLELAKAIVAGNKPADVHLIMAPPAVYLSAVAEVAKDKDGVFVAGQNCHQKSFGAFTGEISAEMLRSVGCTHVILGHSERREYFGETDALLAEKTNHALEVGLTPIFCCGEPLEIRQAETHEDFVATQLKNALFHLDAEAFSKIVLAYEPIWAIGTGLTASPEQAQDMHKSIRDLIAGKYGQEVADNTTILYGGSCKPANAKELFSQADVDGGLIGGASLDADAFLAIAASY